MSGQVPKRSKVDTFLFYFIPTQAYARSMSKVIYVVLENLGHPGFSSASILISLATTNCALIPLSIHHLVIALDPLGTSFSKHLDSASSNILSLASAYSGHSRI